MTVRALAQQTGVNVETVRFYESKGLLPTPERDPMSGYRLYTADAVNRVRFVRAAKQLGFSLRDVHDLLTLRTDQHIKCAEVRHRAQSKLAEIDQKLTSLRIMRRELRVLIAKCERDSFVSDCPIIAALESTGDSAE